MTPTQIALVQDSFAKVAPISEQAAVLFYVGIIGFVLDRMIAGLAKIVTRGTAMN